MIILIVILMAITMVMIGWCIFYLREILMELGSMGQEEEVFPDDPEDPEEPNIFKPIAD